MAERTCSIDGCDSPLRARGFCSKHWERWKKWGDPLIERKPGQPASPEAETERRRKIGEASRGRKLGPPSEETRRKISEALTGRTLSPEHRQAVTIAHQERRNITAAASFAQWEKWRDERGLTVPGYHGLHARVRKLRGPARNYRCVDCDGPALHWSTVHETDGTDPMNHYRPMCEPCHFAYDEVAPRSMETKGPERRSATAVLAWSRRTPEERRAIALRAWETKRRNRGQQDVAPDPALARVHDGQLELFRDACEL